MLVAAISPESHPSIAIDRLVLSRCLLRVPDAFAAWILSPLSHTLFCP
jgi:hypothetical protein